MPTHPSLAKELFEPRRAQRRATLKPIEATDPRGLAQQIFARSKSNRLAWWSLGTATAAGALLLLSLSSLEIPARAPSPRAPTRLKTRLNPPPQKALPPEPKAQKAAPAPEPAPEKKNSQTRKPSPKSTKSKRAPRGKKAPSSKKSSTTTPTQDLKAPILDLRDQSPGVVQGRVSSGQGSAGGSLSGTHRGPGGVGGSAAQPQRKGSRARAPGVAGAGNWNCRWPQAAAALESHEERVLVEVSIDRRGRIRSAKVIRDPGFGFGAEALRCARKQRYRPARDARGQAVGPRKILLGVNFQRE